MVQAPQILVHVSAPSRIVDDARYRKEAWGILGFEPIARHTLVAFIPKEGDTGTEALKAQPAANVEKQLLGQEPERTTLQISQIGHYAIHTRTSPEAAATSTVPGISESASLFQNTTPIPLLPRPRTTKSPFIHIERTPAVERPRIAPTSSTSSQENPSLRRTQSDSWEPPPSVVPDSQPSQRPLKRGVHSSSLSPPQHEYSRPTKRRRQNSFPMFIAASLAHESPTSVALEAPVGSSLPPSTSSQTSPPPPTPLFPFSIHSPPPPTSNTHFTTHLTLSFTSITKPITEQYKPTTQTRIPAPLERGHWLFSTTALPPDIKRKFWDFLSSFLNEGRAGWGVWCTREGEVVKVYCWGEVVREVWCLLFVASHRRIKGGGARWVDGGGEVVVGMG